MNGFWNDTEELNNGRQVPPNVRFVEQPGQPQPVVHSPVNGTLPNFDRYPAHQVQQMPHQTQYAPQTPQVQNSKPLMPWMNNGKPPASFGVANRPTWFWLAMAGIPSATILLTSIAVVVGMNSGGAVQKSSMEGITAIAMESARQRGDITCVSWSCDKFADAIAEQGQGGERYVKSGTMDVRWGDAQATFSTDPQQQGQGQATQASQPVSAPSTSPTAVIQTTSPGASIWQNNQVVNTIPNGDRVKVLRRDGDWVLVNWIASGDFVGWVKASDIQF